MEELATRPTREEIIHRYDAKSDRILNRGLLSVLATGLLGFFLTLCGETVNLYRNNPSVERIKDTTQRIDYLKEIKSKLVPSTTIPKHNDLELTVDNIFINLNGEKTPLNKALEQAERIVEETKKASEWRNYEGLKKKTEYLSNALIITCLLSGALTMISKYKNDRRKETELNRYSN